MTGPLADHAPDFSALVEVHLLQLPVPVWARTQEHTDELLREFALMTTDPEASASVPARLTRVVDLLTRTYAGTSSEQEARLFAAADAGEAVVDDLAFAVPADAAEACTVLGDLLDEADEYCRQGEHLLTLATPPELVEFRRWYLGEFVSQIGGAAPVPWPDR